MKIRVAKLHILLHFAQPHTKDRHSRHRHNTNLRNRLVRLVDSLEKDLWLGPRLSRSLRERTRPFMRKIGVSGDRKEGKKVNFDRTFAFSLRLKVKVGY